MEGVSDGTSEGKLLGAGLDVGNFKVSYMCSGGGEIDGLADIDGIEDGEVVVGAFVGAAEVGSKEGEELST